MGHILGVILVVMVTVVFLRLGHILKKRSCLDDHDFGGMMIKVSDEKYAGRWGAYSESNSCIICGTVKENRGMVNSTDNPRTTALIDYNIKKTKEEYDYKYKDHIDPITLGHLYKKKTKKERDRK